MSWTNGTILKAGTIIYQIAEPISSSTAIYSITIKDGAGGIRWQGVQGDRWSSTKGWTLTEDVTIEMASTQNIASTNKPDRTIVKHLP